MRRTLSAQHAASAWPCARAGGERARDETLRAVTKSRRESWLRWHRLWRRLWHPGATASTAGPGAPTRPLRRVCMYCGRVHAALPLALGQWEANAAWRAVPWWIHDRLAEGHTGLRLSHGACPACARAHGLVDNEHVTGAATSADTASDAASDAAGDAAGDAALAMAARQFLPESDDMPSAPRPPAPPHASSADVDAPPPRHVPRDPMHRAVLDATAQAVEHAHAMSGALRRVSESLPVSEEWAVQFVERTMHELGAQAAIAGRLTDDGALDVVGACGRGADLLVGGAPLPRDAIGPLAQAVGEGRLLQWPTREAITAAQPALVPVAERFGLHAVVVAPGFHLGHVTGALAVGWSASRHLTLAEQSMLRANAGRLARALARARLYYAERAARGVAEQARHAEAAARADAEAARADAERANRAKDEFLAVVSHELRTPMQAILGFSDLLTTGIAGPLTDRQRDYVTRVQAAGGQLLDTIENLLGFARAQAGKENVHAAPFDAATVLAQVLGMAAPLADRKTLALRQRGPCAGVPMTSDERKVRQILTNLVANAVKFTPYGEVSAWAEAEGDRVRLVVRDTGVGIAPEQQARVFEPFAQVEGATTRASGGTGLGLSIVRQLARLLGGDVRLESAVGRGSTFTVELPRVWGAGARDPRAAA